MVRWVTRYAARVCPISAGACPRRFEYRMAVPLALYRTEPLRAPEAPAG